MAAMAEPDATTYTFINPHDDYSFEAPDDDIATTAVVLLPGLYGWEKDGHSLIPNLHPADEEIGAAIVELAKKVISDRLPELVAALRSLEIMGTKRRALGVDPDAWHDQFRTSDSDPRHRARLIAARLEEGDDGS